MKLQKGRRVKYRSKGINEYPLIHPSAGRRKSTADSYQPPKGKRQEGPCQEELTDMSLEKVQRRVGSTIWIWKLKQVPRGCGGVSRIIMPTWERHSKK